MDSHTYLTDLSDAGWRLLEPLAAPATRRAGGPPARASVADPHQRHALRAALRLCLALGAWRLLPAAWPPWKTVYHYFRAWRLDETWERIHPLLRRRLRIRLGRDPEPSAGSVDRQSVKTTGVGGLRGYDGAKKVVGRKRHVLVDTEGLIIALDVHPANIRTGMGSSAYSLSRCVPSSPARNCSGSTRGTTAGARARIGSNRRRAGASRRSKRYTASNTIGCPKRSLPTKSIGRSTCRHPASTSSHAAPVVERTFAWLLQSRRLSKEYERLCATSAAWISLAMLRLMLKRLARFQLPSDGFCGPWHAGYQQQAEL